jgi:hypothetical protein
MTRLSVSGTEGTSINPFFGRIASLGGALNPHGFLGSEPKFAEPLARPQGAMLRIAAKLVSDPNNPLRSVRLALHPENEVSEKTNLYPSYVETKI